MIRKLIYQSVLWRGLYFISVLGLNIVIARYFEASYSGLIYFITNSFALVVTIGSLSLESGVGYYVASGKMEPMKLANFSVIWSCFAGLATYVTIKILLGQDLIPVSYNAYSFLAICYICGCMLLNFFLALFYAVKNFFLPNVVMICINTLLIFLPLFGNGKIMTPKLYVNIYFLGFLLQGVILSVFFYMKNSREKTTGLRGKISLSKIFRYSFLAFLANMLFFLVYRIDYWFVQKYCTPEALGNYIQVSKIVQMLLILPAILSSAIFPVIAGRDMEQEGEKLAMLIRSSLLLYLFICLVFAASGYWLFPFIFGESFSDMYLPFILLIPGILSLVMLYPVIAYFAGRKKMWVNIKALLLPLCIIITGDLIFIPMYGIAAAALISSIGYIVYHLYLIKCFRKEFSVSKNLFYKIKFADYKKMKQLIIENFLRS
ncbi:MAG TPA: hypothetical protein PLS00_12745 [Niabella sp.]|nr:hypothetical protein [Niabella sp.]